MIQGTNGSFDNNGGDEPVCSPRRQGMSPLMGSILAGQSDAAVRAARSLLEGGASVRAILADGIEGAMDRLSDKCAMEQYNLLEIMLAGRAVMAVMKLICEDDQFASGEAKGVVLVASLQGDVHDLGKNIVKMALMAKGFSVVDCGKDCPVERLVSKAFEARPMAIGISGLISSIVPVVREVRGALRTRDEALASIPLVAGGAALKQLSAKQLNVDHVAQNVFEGVAFVERLQQGGDS